MASENELQRTVVLVKPGAPAAVLKAVKDLSDTHDFVILVEEQRVLSAPELRELTDIGVSREFASGACTVLAIERLNGLAIWQKACTAAGMDESSGVFSPTPETYARAVAALFPNPLPVQRTFAMIKPDAVRLDQTEQIIAEIQRHGFTIVARQKQTITRAQGEEFYAELKGMSNRKTGQPILPPLLDFMTSGPAVALVLAKPAAIRSWRRLIGPTDPDVARATKPNCLRARFGEGKLPANACHGSDENPGSVAREVRFFFPNLTVEPVPDASAVKAALMNKPEAADNLRGVAKPTLNQVVVGALAELCREKPQGADAIRFLGRYLLSHNPNTPVVEEPEEQVKSAAHPVGSAPYTIVFVLGGPGSGKGTQCALIAKEMNFMHISAGDELRKFADSGKPEAAAVKQIMVDGKIVPYEITLSLLQRVMDQSGRQRFLIDGFPRALDQAFAFEKKICQCAFVLNFSLSDDEMRARLTKRGLTSGRADDNDETIAKRLATFHAQTQPVVQFYDQFHKVKNVDASGSIEQVWALVKPVFE